MGDLGDFRYEKIRAFASRALEIAASESGNTQTICSPVHGPGYGLDYKEAFLSLVGGFYDAIESGTIPSDLHSIEVVELNPTLAKRFKQLLGELQNREPPASKNGYPKKMASIKVPVGSVGRHSNLSSFGAGSERKLKVFVAMPFADQYSDVWEIAIQEACAATGIVCEVTVHLPWVRQVPGGSLAVRLSGHTRRFL